MGNAGFKVTVHEDEWADFWFLAGGGDVVANDAAWKVTQGTGRQVSCAADGIAVAAGIRSDQLGTLTKALPTPVNGRWYLIVRRIIWGETRSVSLEAIQHLDTPSAVQVPTAPPTTYPTVSSDPGVQYDHILAWAWVNSANSVVTIWDLRQFPVFDRFTGQINRSTWTRYTPQWLTSGTAPSLADGSITARYAWISGKTIHFRIALVWGASTSGGNGDFSFTLPAAAHSLGEQIVHVKAWTAGGFNWSGVGLIDAGGTRVRPLLSASRGDSTVNFVRNAGPSNAPGTGYPLIGGAFTFNGAGQNLIIEGTYEAA